MSAISQFDINNWMRVYRARKTVCEMLVDRGFIVDDQDLKQRSDELRERLHIDHDSSFGASVSIDSRSKLQFIAPRRENPTDNIIVFFPTDKLGIKTVKEYVETMQNHGICHAIIVTQNQSTAQARKALEQCAIPLPNSSAPVLCFEKFQEAELQINITRHVLVPKHEVLSENEKREVMSKYKLQLSQFPRIMKDDPVARYYGMTVGQLVKIIRPSETAGRYVTYRVVI
jgi:DNA-directed RNA polymerases I, II, and III subunit RPABC1